MEFSLSSACDAVLLFVHLGVVEALNYQLDAQWSECGTGGLPRTWKTSVLAVKDGREGTSGTAVGRTTWSATAIWTMT